MNGFISPRALRFTLVASACLLSGFVSGANYHGLNPSAFFQNEEINYSKLAWISKDFSETKLSLATVDYPAADLEKQEIKLAEFHLPTQKPKLAFRSQRKIHRQSNLQKLGDLISKINSFDLLEDYRLASQKLRKQFVITMNAPKLEPAKTETIVMAASSAEPVKQIEVVKRTESAHQIVAVKTVSTSVKKAVSIPAPKMNTQKLSIQIPKTTPNENKVVTAKADVQIESKIQVTKKPIETSSIKVKTIQSSADTTLQIQDEIKKSEGESLGNKLENELLEKHIETFTSAQKQANAQVTSPQYASLDHKTILNQPQKPQDPVDHQNDVNNFAPNDSDSQKVVTNACKGLPKLRLVKPSQGIESENIQICPERKTWISKNWNQEGWLKLETEGYFPVLTYYPQVNSEKTLLLDQNSVALLAIKSGIHFSHGTGMVLGTIPQGYKVEFSGRAEDVEYFELNSKKYFILMNVEPGAGVTELHSEKNTNDSAAVFTPVLADTVTYLDLAAPITVNLPVAVIKGKDQPSTDLNGLIVALSTQTQVQAITQNNGKALMKNVRLIPGYPVFVDVSSKLNGERSYQYRYQLNKRTRDGTFVLRQYPEKLIYQWLKQVKVNLSDDSAMVFGQINRKRLDGFKKHYSVKVDSLNEKYGLNSKTYSVLWDEKLSTQDPLEGDHPRFLSVQVPEGLIQANLLDETGQSMITDLIPVSPRVINVISE